MTEELDDYRAFLHGLVDTYAPAPESDALALTKPPDSRNRLFVAGDSVPVRIRRA